MLTTKTFLPGNLNLIAQRAAERELTSPNSSNVLQKRSSSTLGGHSAKNSLKRSYVVDTDPYSVTNPSSGKQKRKQDTLRREEKEDTRPVLNVAPVGTKADFALVEGTAAYFDIFEGDDRSAMNVVGDDVSNEVRLRKAYFHARACCGTDEHWLATFYQPQVYVNHTRPITSVELVRWLNAQPPPLDKRITALVKSFVYDQRNLAAAFVGLFEGEGGGDGLCNIGDAITNSSAELSEFASCKRFCQVNKISLSDVASWLDGEDAHCRDKSAVKAIFEGVIRALVKRRAQQDKKDLQARRAMTTAASGFFAPGESPIQQFRQRLLWEKMDRGILEHVVTSRRWNMSQLEEGVDVRSSSSRQGANIPMALKANNIDYSCDANPPPQAPLTIQEQSAAFEGKPIRGPSRNETVGSMLNYSVGPSELSMFDLKDSANRNDRSRCGSRQNAAGTAAKARTFLSHVASSSSYITAARASSPDNAFYTERMTSPPPVWKGCLTDEQDTMQTTSSNSKPNVPLPQIGRTPLSPSPSPTAQVGQHQQQHQHRKTQQQLHGDWRTRAGHASEEMLKKNRSVQLRKEFAVGSDLELRLLGGALGGMASK